MILSQLKVDINGFNCRQEPGGVRSENMSHWVFKTGLLILDFGFVFRRMLTRNQGSDRNCLSEIMVILVIKT